MRYKEQVITAVMREAGLRRSDAEAAVKAVFDILRDAMTGGEPVTITKFGVFKTVSRSPRTGRNPHTGELVPIPARPAPWFAAAEKLREDAESRSPE